MASAHLYDIEQLLTPFIGDIDAGFDVRNDSSPTSLYQTIKMARGAARAAERNSIHDGNTSEADEHWRTIRDNAPTILLEQSKDLEVACWLTEALLRSNGFQGLRDGFAIIHGLVANFWENLYPMPDEDGMETRVACLAGLNGEGTEGVLISPIRKTIITGGQTFEPFSYWDYLQALDCQKLPDANAREAKYEKLGFTLHDIEKAITETDSAFFDSIREDLEEAIDYYKKTSDLLDEHCGAYEAPPTRTILTVLGDCLGAIKHLAKDKFSVAESSQEETAEANEAGTAPSSAGSTQVSAPQQAINNREAAFKKLTEIAEFFRKTEPHSPVSYVLQKAVKWGDMSLNELILELIPDSSSRSHYGELTGVEIRDDDDDD